MKILFVISNIANGGAERVIKNLSDEFDKMGHECEIMYFENNQNYYEFRAKITHLDLYSHRNFWAKFSKFGAIRKAIKKANADFIISFMDQTNINLVISTLGMKKNLILSEHTNQDMLKSKFWRFMRDFSYKINQNLVVINASEKAYYGFVKNCELIYNPIEFGEILDDFSQKENMILSVGRLETVKGYANYLNALSLVDSGVLSSWRVCIAGSGSLENELKNQAKNLGLKVEFLGHQNPENLYKKAKILALPSLSECLPNVLNECVAYGCARIATPTTGAKELIENEQNGVITSFEPSIFALDLQKLIQDEKKREILAKNAQKRLSEFEPSFIAQKWLKYFKRIENDR